MSFAASTRQLADLAPPIHLRGGRDAPFSVYCDWGMHDELGDTVELDAAMAHRALDRLEQWKQQYGLGFDYYLIDCFWFDPARGYEHFKATHWPDGFEPIRERVADLGMKLGLWYSTNGLRLNVPEWDSSSAGSCYSLVDGTYAEALERSWMYAIEHWDLRLIKLDFAAFTVAAQGVDRPAQETYRQSVRRLKDLLRRVRERASELRVIAHCGYQRARHGTGPGNVHSPGNDPSWLEVVDHLFSGDPLPADTPRTSLARAADLFQDRQVYRVHRDGLPLHRIEDHGVMIGATNTCLHRGRIGVRRSHLAQLARGGRRDMFYGDPTLLEEGDVRGIAATRDLFFDAFSRGLETCCVGPDEPGIAPWHGYLTGGGDAGLLYLVNSTFDRQRVSLPLPGLFEAAVLFDDGPAPALQVQPDRLQVVLGPEQVVLVGLGSYARPDMRLGAADDPPPVEMTPLDVTLRPSASGLVADLPAPADDDRSLLVVVRLLDSDPQKGPLLAPPRNAAKQDARSGDTSRSVMTELVRIRVTADGQERPADRRVPDRPVWSGMSWTVEQFAWREACHLEVAVTEPARWTVDLYACRFTPSA